MLLKRKFVTVIMILLIFSAKCHISDVYNICQKMKKLKEIHPIKTSCAITSLFIVKRLCNVNDNELNDLEKRISDIENEFNTGNELKQEINLAKNKEEFKKILVPQNGIFLGVVSHLSWLASRIIFLL